MTICTRCQGMMLNEDMIDMEREYGQMWARSWRCFNCSHRDDAVLQHHPQQYAKPMAVSPPTVTIGGPLEVARESEEAEPLAA